MKYDPPLPLHFPLSNTHILTTPQIRDTDMSFPINLSHSNCVWLKAFSSFAMFLKKQRISQ